MTIQEFTDRLKVVKVKDTDLLFRTAAGVTFDVKGLFYGVKTDTGAVAVPQVGDEPDCVVVQVAEV